MAISRVSKLICSAANFQSYEEACASRKVDIDLYMGHDSTSKTAKMALLAVSLALRCFNGQIRCHIPRDEPASLSWSKQGLTNLLKREAEGYGASHRLNFSDVEGAVKLGLGINVPGGVSVDASLWEVGVNTTFKSGETAYAPAAALAVSCGFAKLFNAHVLKQPSFLEESWSLSLKSLAETDSAGASSGYRHLGRISLLGAGAIGTAFMYCLWLEDWSANVDIIDRDCYEEANEETSFFITPREARRNRKKAATLCEYATRPDLALRPLEANVKEGSLLLQIPTDAFVCAVDNPETRRALDAACSDLLINGAVGGRPEDAGHILWSRHRKEDPQLSARYSAQKNSFDAPVNVPNEFQDECSRIAYNSVSLAAPFLGMASASLLLSSCVLDRQGEMVRPNYFKMDLFKMQSKPQVEIYAK